jgi:hypothetical protein
MEQRVSLVYLILPLVFCKAWYGYFQKPGELCHMGCSLANWSQVIALIWTMNGVGASHPSMLREWFTVVLKRNTGMHPLCYLYSFSKHH